MAGAPEEKQSAKAAKASEGAGGAAGAAAAGAASAASTSAAAEKKDVTDDFLLCNRCGLCRSVCPVFDVFHEEWAGARGKVELAEAFFRGEKIDDKDLRRVFDLCLHCMTCEENCPSGMRADEIVMAVRAEMARRGLMPWAKRVGLRLLGGMDNALFKAMRALGLARRAPLHGVGRKGPLSFLYPLVGWPRERFIPLPSAEPFLSSGPELYRASDVGITLPDPDEVRHGGILLGETIDKDKAADLIERVTAACRNNADKGRRAYFFVGHAVNQFFPEEARAVTRLLNILGIDVLVPKNQVCCGAPMYYAGDIEATRKSAAEMLEKFEGQRYDWIVTTCSSGGLMLKEEIPRLFDIYGDGYFEITWDAEMEMFVRSPRPDVAKQEFPEAENLYKVYVEGKVRDVNELIAEQLGLEAELEDLAKVLGGAEGEPMGASGAAGEGGGAGASGAADMGGPMGAEGVAGKGMAAGAPAGRASGFRIVTYHEPCHLNRGQEVDWQPEAILKALTSYRYVRMKDADRCCGGGGSFTFLHSEASAEVARKKMDAVADVRPDVLATACPLCRLQLMDMLRQRFVVGAKGRHKEPVNIPVVTPPELLLEDLLRIMGAIGATARG
jgi:Fe-S oxidoreductase